MDWGIILKMNVGVAVSPAAVDLIRWQTLVNAVTNIRVPLQCVST
jgi:hypothetical protein